MWKNYLKIAWRNLFKNKVDSVISIGGLAVGLACCILLTAYVHFEWSFDNFHENADRLYRVVETEPVSGSDEMEYSTITPSALATTLEATYPQIEYAIKLIPGLGIQVERDGKFQPDEALVTGSGFFRMFSFSLLTGSAENVLSSPGNIVLTSTKARELFGKTGVVGETVNVVIDDQERSYTVSAIAKAPPANSSIDFEMVIPFDGTPRGADIESEYWGNGYGETWVQLTTGATPEELEQQFPDFMELHYGPALVGSIIESMWLQPVSDIYFNQEVDGILEQSNRTYSFILAGIAAVVLLIACINFVSLTLGRSASRNHEIGIRKVAGAQRMQLAGQFLGEVFVTCGAAFLCSLVLAEMLLPYFRQIVQEPVSLDLVEDPVLLLLFGGVLLIATVVTGGYPAVVLSSRKITSAFRSHGGSGRVSPFVKGLISIQFAMTIAFIAVTFLMQQQLQFVFSRDLGYNPKNVVKIDAGGLQNPTRGVEMYRLFGEEARRIPGISEVTGSSSVFSNDIEGLTGFTILEARITTDVYRGPVYREMADAHFLETMGIELVQGRNFSSDNLSDINEGMIVNQKMAEVMGWEHPIGQTIEDKWGSFDGMKVIGVMENYHDRSFFNEIQPLVLTHREAVDYSWVGTILVRVEGVALNGAVEELQTLWQEVLPGESFNYGFLDDYVRRQYEEEQRWSSIMQTSSAASILLACFGLFGLAALASQRRTKEIGIRKVLGATVSGIVTLLSKDFVKLVAIGFVMAVPLAYYAMDRWLEAFAYKIEIGADVFIAAGATALIIALATVSWQSIRAARANPVDSLRAE